MAGQQSQLLYNSTNATLLGMVCNGLKFTAVQSPSLYLNQSWYWFAETWLNPGTQSCNIHAHNSMGEVAVMLFDLVVGPAGFGVPSGGGADGGSTYPPGDPRNPPPTGTNAGSGNPQGYIGPDGTVYSDPGGTIPCWTCNAGAGVPVNVEGTTNPTVDPVTGEPTSGGGTTYSTY